MKRQNYRRLILIVSLLLFPITLYYFSPALIINAAFHHLVNGSFIVFCLMFFLSIPFGRLFCGYLCPAGGLQECLYSVNDRVPRHGKKDLVKFAIWIIWLFAVVICYVKNGGISGVDPLYETENGISVSSVQSYIIFYGILCLILVPCVIGGRRTFCRCICWMAPFMIAGSRIRRAVKLPGLHVAAGKGCISCGKCSRTCPMGIDVQSSVIRGRIESDDCILCGTCVDNCPKHALRYGMRFGKDGKTD